MAKKTKPRSPIPEPPSDSSDEEQMPSSQQHHDQEEEENDDEDEASSQEEHQPVPPSNNSHPKPAPSESDSGSESDPPPPPPKSKLKPLPPKPTDHTPNPNSKPHPSKKDRSTSKRTAKSNDAVNDSKRSKKKKGTDAAAASAVAAASSSDDEDAGAKKTGGDSRKLFQRLWSEEDEIAILKGMVEFTSKTGSDPYKYADAFHNFMKKSLHVEASSNQLKQKIRRLKKKFETNANKGSFLKPHDQQAFELSKKVWGNAGGGGGGVEKSKLDEKAANFPTKEGRKSTKVAPPKQKPELQHELRSMDDSKKAVKMNVDEKSDTTYVGFGLYGLNEDMVKKGMELIGASERAELEEEWKELQHAELELYVKRAELVANQTRLILEAYKSSNH